MAKEQMVEEIDLRELLKTVQKRSRLIIAGTLLCALTMGLISFFILPPVYEAETLLMVTQATEKLQNVQNLREEGLEEVVGSVSRLPVWTMNTYLGQIKSEALMKRIIAELELNPELYTPVSLARMIDASVVKDSNLIEVKVRNSDPVLASRIANTLSEEYLRLMTEKNQEQMSRSMSFLNEQKEITEGQLEKALEELKEVQGQPRNVAVLEAEFSSMLEEKKELTSRLQAVQVEIQQLDSGINKLEQELSGISEYIYVEKWDEEAQAVTTVKERNTLYVSLAQSLAEKKAELAEKQGEEAGLQAAMASLTGNLENLQAELAEKRLEEEKLVREVERLKKTAETLAEKTTETQIAKSINLGDTSVIVVSASSVPLYPVKPNKKLNIAVAFVLGLMVFTMLAFVIEYLDNTLKTPDDVTRELELPVLGVIPAATAKDSR
ncbi:MAG: lipopolysaccharide biosynthesis protein [Syntrophomonadaceae bacterium]|nr:lipopolysaccharide biosynthesis protein [Syntrophomonadaceae bacterium]